MTTTTDLNVLAPMFTSVLTPAQHFKLVADLEKKRVLQWAQATGAGGYSLAQALQHAAEMEKTAAIVADWESASICSAASAASTVEAGCFFCHKEGHKRAQCPQLKCWYCQKQGHQQKDCRAFAKDQEWAKWARKQQRRGHKLSGGQLQFLKDWDARTQRR